MNKGEIIRKYGDVKLKFKYYYKYSFYYEGKAPDGAVVCASYGGDSEDIYKFRVDVDEEETLDILYPDFCSIVKDGVEIGSFDNF